MSRKTKEEAEKTRSRILANALTLFVKKGYENTTFIDIAEKLKMTKGAVYWHFKSKSDLLSALMEEALNRFSSTLSERIKGRELTFVEVGNILVEIAERIVSEKKRCEFFMLMQVGLKWTDKELANLAKRLIAQRIGGPYEAVVDALKADISSGRVSKNVDAEEIARAVMSAWDGIIRRKIEGFLVPDMTLTLRNFFNAVWSGIKTNNF
jgi:AcrR family transcriptional regulator